MSIDNSKPVITVPNIDNFIQKGINKRQEIDKKIDKELKQLIISNKKEFYNEMNAMAHKFNPCYKINTAYFHSASKSEIYNDLINEGFYIDNNKDDRVWTICIKKNNY